MSARILEKGERADSLYGREDVFITRHDLSELANGKRLYITVNMEYAIVVKVLEQPEPKWRDKFCQNCGAKMEVEG